jgi:hypothetical protein
MTSTIQDLTRHWGPDEAVTLYLDRCQVDTPPPLVARIWELIVARRTDVGTVLDLGAGDGRFARGGRYNAYFGVEVDSSRFPREPLPSRAQLVHQCVFDAPLPSADVCLGNPPYVRNQDLPLGWRQRAAAVIAERVGVRISGLANAWQYFALLALGSAKTDGLVALVLPYEWVSRPSAKGLRGYVKDHHWNVDCYRLLDGTFDRVLTTCSIAVIDKRTNSGIWRYFEECCDGSFKLLKSPSGRSRPLDYRPRRTSDNVVRAKRGLSPGTQRWLVLTEPARARYGLRIGRDVVACVTTLRPVRPGCATLTPAVFARYYRDAGVRCWLVRSDRDPSPELRGYLDAVPRLERDNWTCNSREEWWRFDMPIPPSLLVSSGFRGAAPKVVVNAVRAVAVGSVTGVYGLSASAARRIGRRIRHADLSNQVVAHSNGLRKVEVGQLQALIETYNSKV